MELNFYGIKAAPPTSEVAKAFGSSADIVKLQGGQKTTYRSGGIVLKPSEGMAVTNEIAEIFEHLPRSMEVRIPRPIRAQDGSWIVNGYAAWEFLEGVHGRGNYSAKLEASLAFHRLFEFLPQPSFLENPRDSWSAADKVVWQGGPYEYDARFRALIDRILPHLQPLNLKRQLTHGDLSGNFLLHHNSPPAIIDFSPAWAPNGFAEGIMLADAITWEGANKKELKPFKEIPNIAQFAWRGVLRRILEQAEHTKWLEKPVEQALKESLAFEKALDFLSNL